MMVWAKPKPIEEEPRNGSGRNGRRPIPKRAIRLAYIEKIRKQLRTQIESAEEHAQSTLDRVGLPDLLPRPTKKHIAALAGCSPSALTRCFQDCPELEQLWKNAGNADYVFRCLNYEEAPKQDPEPKDADYWDEQMAHDRRR